jgi:glycosyltransferase involved in cell wall biosynthesis
MPTFSIITATLQRDSLSRCCQSVDAQTEESWQHIVVVDGGPLRADLLDSIQRPNRTIVHLGARCQNFGNTPRHIGWKLAHKDYCIYLDDDNYFTRPDALADISRCLEPRPDWAVFPIDRFGSRFFSDDPRCCHVDTANMVIAREIAQWPNREEYTLDGIFCDELKSRYLYTAFPEISPIIAVPVMGKGE